MCFTVCCFHKRYLYVSMSMADQELLGCGHHFPHWVSQNTSLSDIYQNKAKQISNSSLVSLFSSAASQRWGSWDFQVCIPRVTKYAHACVHMYVCTWIVQTAERFHTHYSVHSTYTFIHLFQQSYSRNYYYHPYFTEKKMKDRVIK